MFTVLSTEKQSDCLILKSYWESKIGSWGEPVENGVAPSHRLWYFLLLKAGFQVLVEFVSNIREDSA